MPQINLFGKSIEKPKPSYCYNNNDESFEELERRVAKKYGRRHIGYPCDEAQDLPIDDRQEHIYNPDGSYKCPECKRLIEDLEKRFGYNKK